MREAVSVSYVKCGFCTAKNRCAACGAELTAELVKKPGISSAAVDLLQHSLQVDYSIDREELEDLLDGMGLLEE